MNIEKFYTVVVLAVDIFESRIVDERHFRTQNDAEGFKNSIGKEYIGVVVEV